MLFSFVTALYPIREGYLSELQSRFLELLDLLPEVPIHVWTDRDWPEISDSRIVWQKVPLTGLKSYQQGIDSSLQLPNRRNTEKDTHAFMALMNSKIEMLWRIAPFLSENHTLLWIDAGILKIFKNKDLVQDHLKVFQKATTPEKVLMPGCWGRGIPVSRDSVHWRFCGGFFVVPLSLLPTLQSLSEKWIDQVYVVEQRAMWEVNVWVEMENELPELFQWYLAGHDDTIVAAPLKIEE
jgi:hypothetical protein